MTVYFLQWTSHKTITTLDDTFYACNKFIQISQNGPLDKIYAIFIFMRSSVLCIVMYWAIKVYAVQIYATGAWLT